MPLNSLDIECSCINYFQPGINPIEDVRLLSPMALVRHPAMQFPFLEQNDERKVQAEVSELLDAFHVAVEESLLRSTIFQPLYKST